MIIIIVIIIVLQPATASTFSSLFFLFMPCQFLFDIAVYFVQKEKRSEKKKKSLSNPHSEAFNKAGHYLTGAFVRPIQERTKWLFRRTL